MTDKQTHSDLVQKIITGSRWAAMLRYSGQLFSWLSTIIVVRFIAPGDYGLNNMLQSPLQVMMFLSGMGLNVALVQSRKLEDAELRSIFGWLLVINSILFLVYFFGGSLIAVYFKEPRLEDLAKVLAFIFLLAPFRVIPNALLDRELKFKLRAQVELWATVLSTLLTLGLAIHGDGVWALILGVLANRVLQAILLMIIEPWFIRPSLNYATAHRLMTFGGIAAGTNVVAMVGGMVVSLIAGRQLGSELLGIYAVATQFAMLPLAKIMPVINQSLVPAFSKFQTHPDVAARYMEKAMGIVSLIMVPAMIGMASIADAFVHTLMGAKWSDATLPLALLSVMMLLRIITMILRPVITSMGRPDLSFTSNLVILILLIPATLLGVGYGVIGLVGAIFGVEVVGTIVTIVLSKRALDVSAARIFQSMWPALLSSMIMALCIFGVRSLVGFSGGGLDLLLGVGVGVVSYYIAMRLMFADKLLDVMLLLLGNRKLSQKLSGYRTR